VIWVPSVIPGVSVAEMSCAGKYRSLRNKVFRAVVMPEVSATKCCSLDIVSAVRRRVTLESLFLPVVSHKEDHTGGAPCTSTVSIFCLLESLLYVLQYAFYISLLSSGAPALALACRVIQ
jgi:hypothetical protein